MKLIRYIFLFIIIFSCSKEDDFTFKGVKQEFIIKSTLINDDYPIYVFLPENYNTRSNNNQLIIALDGNTRFNDIAKIISEKAQKKLLPPTIFIAIGNNEQRNRDYTPTSYSHGKGGANNFYLFIKDELIPELESRYNINPNNNKLLMGHSFGGLFTQFVMAQNRASNPFNKFIASGTSYWYDSGVIFEYEQNYAKNHTDLNVTFYNGMGTLEGGVMLASFEEMNERLQKRAYLNFKHKSELIEGSGHKNSANTTFKKGLDYVFNN